MFQSLDDWVETPADNLYREAVRYNEFNDIESDDHVTLTGLARMVRFMTRSSKKIRPLLSAAAIAQNQEFSLEDWIEDGRPFGAASKQGSVVSARLFKKRRVVLKSYKNLFDTARRDYIVGTVMANRLRMQCPFFVYTLGAWRDDTGHFCVLTDMVAGSVFADCIKTCSSVEFLNVFAQVLFALETGQREFRFCHYDMHMRNVIVRRRTKPTVCSLGVYDYVFSYEKYPVIIDLGMSFIETKEGETVGPSHLEKFGIFNTLRSGYDAFTFLLFAYKEMEDKRIVRKLLSFFGNDLNLSAHVECLKKYTDDKTPGMMLDWMLSAWPDVIAVRRIDRRRIQFHMPEEWCAARLLKSDHRIQVSVVDPSAETGFASYQMARHVNAHMGHFEKRDGKCSERIRNDFKLIVRPIADIELACQTLLLVRHLGFDRKSKTYSGWVRSLVATPEFKKYAESEAIGPEQARIRNRDGRGNVYKHDAEQSVDVDRGDQARPENNVGRSHGGPLADRTVTFQLQRIECKLENK